MSQPPPLPESLADWPVTARHVLGVPADSDKKTIRRAYARLLRTYRPEDEPEKFNRILQARDELLQMAAVRPASRPAAPEDDDSTVDWSSVPTTLTDSPASPSPVPRPRADGASDDVLSDDAGGDYEVRRFAATGAGDADGQPKPPTLSTYSSAPATPDSAWKRAIAGEYEVAHAQLVQLTRQSGSQVGQAAVRLYWLERLVPSLTETGTRPVDRLLAHATAIDPETLHALLRAEAGGREAVLLQPELRKLLSHNPEWHLGLLADRWHAAVRADSVDVVRDDLEALSAMITQSVDKVFLTAAAELSLSPKSVDLLVRCLDEVRDSALDRGWTPHGSAELTYELAAESRDRFAGHAIPPADWVADLLRDCPVHPVLGKQYYEEQLGVWWRAPDLVITRLRDYGQAAPLMAARLMESIESVVPYDEDRVAAAGEAAMQSVSMDQIPSRIVNRYESICRTFLVPVSAVCRHLQYEFHSDERVNHQLMMTLQQDVPLRTLTAGWAVYAVPLTIQSVDRLT